MMWIVLHKKEVHAMQVTLTTLLIICPLTFLAGFIDSIAGGGGLISLPSYLFIGLPSHLALGTNKFSSSFGTLIATLRYAKNRQIHYKSAFSAAAAALAGSYLGALLALTFDEKFLRWLLVVLLPVITVFMLVNRKFGDENRASALPGKKIILLSVLAGLVIGAYDGFFGPGTGTFLILVFTGLIGFDLTTASGNTKVVNLASNIAAVTAFMLNDAVVFAIAVPAALSGMLGNWLGSGLAIKSRSRVIRPVFMTAVTLLFIKVLWDLVN
jgi:hypothetical protein